MVARELERKGRGEEIILDIQEVDLEKFGDRLYERIKEESGVHANSSFFGFHYWIQDALLPKTGKRMND